MSDISLIASTRRNLLGLQRTDQLRLQTTNRLSTGKKVNRITDDPVKFSQSFALSNRVSDLLSLKKGTGQALSAVETAINGVGAIEKLGQQLRGLALSARTASGAQRQELAQQFNVIRSQIDNLARDVSYGGVSLLGTPAASLTQKVGDISGGQVTVDGQSSSSSALGIGSATTSYNSFSTSADIEAALTGVQGAVTTLRASASQFGSSVAALNIAEDFNQSLSQTLQAGQDKLVNANLNKEAANLLSVDIRNQLGQQGLRITQRSGAAVLQLLNGIKG